jgi:hypothetical protein
VYLFSPFFPGIVSPALSGFHGRAFSLTFLRRTSQPLHLS